MAKTPRGIRNNNPGNVRLSRDAWQGEITPGTDKSFMQFDTMANGVRCLAKILIGYQRKGLNTPREMINRWAPPTENNSDAYDDQVAKALGIDDDTPFVLSPDNLLIMTRAICKHENGGDFVSEADLKAGVNAALQG